MAMAVTLRNLEQDSLGFVDDDMMMMKTWDEVTLRVLARKFGRGEETGLRDCASFGAVWEMVNLRHEIFSLMPVEVKPQAIFMTEDEMRLRIRGYCSEERVEGRTGATGMFEHDLSNRR